MAPGRVIDEELVAWSVEDLGASFVSKAKCSPQHVLSGEKTDYTRWRLRDDRGRQTWHYLTSDEEVRKWPQSTADRYHLGLPTNLPNLPKPNTPIEGARNGISYFSHLQLPPGNWACDYGGPMFLLPGLVITWYVTNTPIPESHRIEISNYLFARQHAEDGGWGLHIEGESTVFGTVMNYVVLRLLGADADNPRMTKARGKIGELGGAVKGPHWAKFWLAVLGVADWDLVNPVPPELWLLPDWVPFAPWRWWIHMRQVFAPMSYIYSRRFSYPPNELTLQLRQEVYTQSYSSINFASHRNSISPVDNYHPKTWILNTINWNLTNWWPYVRPDFLARRAEAWVFELIQMEDANTEYANLGPVNGPMNLLACYIHDGPDAKSVHRHRDRMADFLWVKNEGMQMNGTNGVQTWDTSFLIQAAVACGFHHDPTFKPMLTRALEFLEDQQIRADCVDQDKCYRQQRNGAWAFSTRDQGYTVSDCTSEALKAVLYLQNTESQSSSSPAILAYPTLLSSSRIRSAVDVLLTMQNPTGGFASYEPSRAGPWMETLNAAEVFGNIMVEYDYPECTTAAVTALSHFRAHDAEYRAQEIKETLRKAHKYILRAQRPEGGWYGSWGVCFTYATMFAVQALVACGERYPTSPALQRACAFLVGHADPLDGGWGESYRACETGEWVDHPAGSQVVNTSWACIALLEAGFPERGPVEKALRGVVVGRQKGDGGWEQEGIEGVFNKSCMISYPNYKHVFSVMALGAFARRWGDGWAEGDQKEDGSEGGEKREGL